jgi:hypothetical protein
MKKLDPKAEMYLTKAKRFRQRAAGFRHTLKRDDLFRSHRLELERMVVNLEGAAKQLERMAGGADSHMDAEFERVRALRAGAPAPAAVAAQRFPAAANNVARTRAKKPPGAAPAPLSTPISAPKPAPKPALKPASGRPVPLAGKYARRPGS